MKYRAEIDGLRALAVLPVIVFHADLGFMAGGFAGVDVFFVISGFLITGILLDDLAADRFSVLHFYERRARRILPALSLVILVCFPVALVVFDPRRFDAFAESAVAASLFFANIHFWQTLDYFNAQTTVLPLIHTWSLAVEEQYYFVFPPVLWLLWRAGKRFRGDWLLWALILATLGSFALSAAGSALELRSNFYLLPTRAWEMLAGSLAALHVHRHGLPVGRWTGPASLLGLILLAGTFQFMDKSFGFPGPWTLIPVTGTLLLLLCARPGGLAGRFLTLRPVVGIGLISYSAYLWHQPLFVFARLEAVDVSAGALMLVMGLLSLVLAWASWRFVERPFRDRTFLDRRQLFAAALAMILVPAAAGGVASTYGDLNRRVFVAALGEEARARWLAWEAVRDAHALVEAPCHFTATDIDAAMHERLVSCAEAHGPVILLTGDSHAGDVFNAIARTLPERAIVLLAEGGCRPGQGYAGCHPAPLLSYLRGREALFDTVVYTQAGFWYWIADRDPPFGRWAYALSEGAGEINGEIIDRTADYVEALSRLAPTVWLGPRYEPHIDVGSLYRRPPGPILMKPEMIDQISRVEASVQARIARWDGEAPAGGPRYVSQLEEVTREPEAELMRDGAFLYNDGDHWSPAGEAFFGARIVEALGLEPTAR
ncbi:MAG: acyltransferase family protein [Pseudomonadota bacterium]